MNPSAVAKTTRLAIFASGSGSNAQAIMEHFRNHGIVTVALIITNKSDAGVIERAKAFDIKSVHHTNSEFKDGTTVIQTLIEHDISYIALAGFLRKIPSNLFEKYPEHIINIHPALLPKFGGKGMYGMNVHRAVKEAKETKSGPTIHLVNEDYDKGAILFQASDEIIPSDTPEDIAAKVLALEHQYYPKVIESYIIEHLS